MSQSTITIVKNTDKKQKPQSKDIAFGRTFTDHMFVMDYESDKGWHEDRKSVV